MRSPATLTRRTAFTAAIALAGLAVSACGGSSSSEPSSSGAAAPSGTPAPATVSVALSWTPNTDYTGVYVADQLGYYKAQGITLKIIPYGSTAPETLVSRGRADFGFSYQAGVTYARAAGQDIVSVFAPHQKGTYAIGVSASRTDITSPKDLDGKIYAGFGTPDEGPELKYVIKKAGGTGTFRTVTLSTSAYQAVYSGKADFTIPVVTWEGVEAELVGKPFKTFALTDYGFPEQYSALLAASGSYLKENTDLAKRFLAATTKGYTYAAQNPKEAADLLVKANPAQLTNPELVEKSQQLLVDGGYLTATKGEVGTQSDKIWLDYGSFLFTNGLLADADGKPLTTAPDWSSFYSNAYLPTETP
jgi:ABC-type nitrate/sulfonate/bicarbonate transport system substrate-binding protein